MSQRMAGRWFVLALLAGLLSTNSSPAKGGFDDLFVSIRNGSSGVVRVDTPTGNLLGTFAASGSSQGVAFGPDGSLYVASFIPDAVLKFDRSTGAHVGGSFTTGAPLNGNSGLTFGPDGNLYAASYNGNDVLRYNGHTGAYDKVFATGVTTPYGVTFGRDGNLYVGDVTNNRIDRFNGTTGAFIDHFVNGGVLNYPGQFAFGPDGNLYVSSFNTNKVIQYDGTTGQVVNGSFASVIAPTGLSFGPDGSLYVASFTNGTIGRYNGLTGAFQNLYASGLDGGPTFLTFVPEPSSIVLMAIGTIGLGLWGRRRRSLRRSNKA